MIREPLQSASTSCLLSDWRSRFARVTHDAPLGGHLWPLGPCNYLWIDWNQLESTGADLQDLKSNRKILKTSSIATTSPAVCAAPCCSCPNLSGASSAWASLLCSPCASSNGRCSNWYLSGSRILHLDQSKPSACSAKWCHRPRKLLICDKSVEPLRWNAPYVAELSVAPQPLRPAGGSTTYCSRDPSPNLCQLTHQPRRVQAIRPTQSFPSWLGANLKLIVRSGTELWQVLVAAQLQISSVDLLYLPALLVARHHCGSWIALERVHCLASTVKLLEFPKCIKFHCDHGGQRGKHTHTLHNVRCQRKTYLGCCYIAKTTGNCDKSPNDSKRWIQNTPLPKHEKCCNLIPCQDTRQVDRTCHRQKAYHETGLAANLAQSLKHAAVLPIQLLPFRIFRIES